MTSFYAVCIACAVLILGFVGFIGYDLGYRKGQEKTLETIEKKLRGLL